MNAENTEATENGMKEPGSVISAPSVFKIMFQRTVDVPTALPLDYRAALTNELIVCHCEPGLPGAASHLNF